MTSDNINDEPISLDPADIPRKLSFNMCDDLMYTLCRLDIGYNRVIRYWMAVELHILLTLGEDALEAYRLFESEN